MCKCVARAMLHGAWDIPDNSGLSKNWRKAFRTRGPLEQFRPTDDESAKGTSMEERTTHTSVTFSHAFTLTGIEGSQPAGVYRIETVDVLLDNVSCLTAAYRRISTTIELPAMGESGLQRQLSAIDSRELEAALRQDAAGQGELARTVSK